MRDTLIEYIKAGYPGLYLVTFEEKRVRNAVQEACVQLKRRLLVWSCTSGLVEFPPGEQPVQCTDPNNGEAITDPLNVLDTLLRHQPEKTVLVALDFHMFLADSNPLILRKVKDTLFALKQQAKTLVVVGARLVLPTELEKELLVLDFPLPDRTQLKLVLDATIASARRPALESPIETEVLRAASGLTTDEAENAYALSLVRHGQVQPSVVAHEKAMTVRKNGLLEVVDTNLNLDSIGGLDVLKSWLTGRRKSFSSDRAQTYRLPPPRGYLVVGPPGTGKSLTAKATANILGVPLLRLDASRIFGSLVGQSEQNIRSITQIAEAVAPCVVWCDEFEKLFAGSESSGRTDGGTTQRVLGSFLTWMQEKTAPVFIVATSNDVTQLPDALLRRGRWDSLWYVDLPTVSERQSIWDVVIRKFGRDPAAFDLPALAAASNQFVGAEIEQTFVEALHRAFDGDREPDTEMVVAAARRTTPLARSMAGRLDAQRQHWRKFAEPASTPDPTQPAAVETGTGYGRAVEAPPVNIVVVQPPADPTPGQN